MIQTQELNRFGQQGIFALLKEQIWILNKLAYTTKTWQQGLTAEIETRKGYISYIKEKVLISVEKSIAFQKITTKVEVGSRALEPG